MKGLTLFIAVAFVFPGTVQAQSGDDVVNSVDFLAWRTGFVHSDEDEIRLLVGLDSGNASGIAAACKLVLGNDAGGLIGEIPFNVNVGGFAQPTLTIREVAPGAGELLSDGQRVGRIDIDSTGRAAYSIQLRVLAEAQDPRTGLQVRLPRNTYAWSTGVAFNPSTAGPYAPVMPRIPEHPFFGIGP